MEANLNSGCNSICKPVLMAVARSFSKIGELMNTNFCASLTRRRLSPANNTSVVSLVLEFQTFDNEFVLASFHFILRREVFQIDRVAVFRPLCPIRFAQFVQSTQSNNTALFRQLSLACFELLLIHLVSENWI